MAATVTTSRPRLRIVVGVAREGCLVPTPSSPRLPSVPDLPFPPPPQPCLPFPTWKDRPQVRASPTPTTQPRHGFYLVVRDEAGAECDGETAIVKCGIFDEDGKTTYMMHPLSKKTLCLFDDTCVVAHDTLAGLLMPCYRDGMVHANLMFFLIDSPIIPKDMLGMWRQGLGELKLKAVARFLSRAAKAASTNPRTRLGKRIVLRRAGFDAEADMV